jgi:cation diffusion facilitator family transporter
VFSTKTGAAKLLIGVVVCLVAMKILASWLTGSMSILSQAADSFFDLFAGLITFSAIRIATKPADYEHPYGHGKVEDIAGMTQGALIFIAGVSIIYSSVIRIIEGAIVELAEVGIAVMVLSIIISMLLSRHLLKVAKATDSTALEANAKNISADVYSATAVLVGLILVKLTGLSLIDSAIAIGVALYILKISYDTMRKPIAVLLDSRLPHAQETAIKDCVENHSHEVVGFHALRTRRAGSQRYIDLHLVMSKNISLEKAHQICDLIESEIAATIPQSSVIIHAEPCDEECVNCDIVCSKRGINM